MNSGFIYRKLQEGLWRISSSLGQVFIHIYLIDTGDGFLLFDTGLKSTAPAVLELIRKVGCASGDLKTIVISHSHHDHIGANAEIAEATGAKLLAHELAMPWMIDHQRQFREFFEVFSTMIPIADDYKFFFFDNLGRPWYADQWLREFPHSLDFPRPMQLLYTPGHSSDSLSLWLPDEKILICGDAFMGAGVGGNLPQYSDKSAYLKSLSSFLQRKAKMLLSGHFDPLVGEQIQEAIQQSIRLVNQLDEFILKALEKAPCGYPLRFLAEMVCARFSRPVTHHVFITLKAHLNEFADNRQVHFEDERWKFGKPSRVNLPVLNIANVREPL